MITAAAEIAARALAVYELPGVAAIRAEAPANQVVSDSQAGPAIVVSAAGSGLRVAAAILARAPLTAAVADPAVACWAEQVVSFDRATGVLAMAAA